MLLEEKQRHNRGLRVPRQRGGGEVQKPELAPNRRCARPPRIARPRGHCEAASSRSCSPPERNHGLCRVSERGRAPGDRRPAFRHFFSQPAALPDARPLRRHPALERRRRRRRHQQRPGCTGCCPAHAARRPPERGHAPAPTGAPLQILELSGGGSLCTGERYRVCGRHHKWPSCVADTAEAAHCSQSRGRPLGCCRRQACFPLQVILAEDTLAAAPGTLVAIKCLRRQHALAGQRVRAPAYTSACGSRWGPVGERGTKVAGEGVSRWLVLVRSPQHVHAAAD